MERKHARMVTFSQWSLRAAPLILALALSACLESKPKEISVKKVTVPVADTANSETFAFNFAYRDPTVVANPTVYLQGIANSGTTMITTCNAAGTGCKCEFLDSSGNVLSAATTTAAYDSTGNFFTCTYNTGAAALGSLAKARLRNLAATKYSDSYTVATSLTPALIVGSALDSNKVRTVYRYACQYNYLEKIGTGTTSASFVCSTTLSLCGPAGLTGGNFCFVEVKYPFWTFSDNYTTNAYKQMTDQLYNAGGTNLLCNRQALQYDCSSATTGEVASKQFGLYADQAGNFQIPVLLNASPVSATESYGYAAKVGTTGNCPPGMVKRDIFTASIAARSDTSLSATTTTEVSSPTVIPTAISVNERYGNGTDPLLGGTGGYCNDGITCVGPRRDVGDTNKQTLATSSFTAANTPFCVIDPNVLP